MSGSELRQAKEVAIEAARQAGYRLKPHWGQIEHVTKGEQRELVTDLDKSTELFLAEEFKNLTIASVFVAKNSAPNDKPS